MKIAGFIRSWPTHGRVGGMENHAFSLYSGLVRLGHEVHVFTTYNPKLSDIELENGITVHYVQDCEPMKYSQEYFDKSEKLFSKVHQQSPFDVVHSESSAARRLCNKKVPVVATWHGMALDSYRLESNNPNGPIETEKLSERIKKEISDFLKYDISIAISDLAYEDLTKVYNIPEKKVRMIPNGINERIFNVESRFHHNLRTQLQIPEDAIVIGAAGRLVADKGHDDLIAALPKILEEFPNVYCLVAGEGPIARSYIKMASPRIKFVGKKDFMEMPDFYRSLNLFIDPTRRHGGLDRTMFEAMMCGVPVAASDIGSIKKTVIQGKTFGRTFKANDPQDIVRVVTEMIKEVDLKSMGVAASVWARKNVSEKTVAEKMEGIFEEVIVAKGGKLPKKSTQPVLWAITVFFNPAHYKLKYQNYNIFREQLKKQGVPLVAVELSFDNAPFELQSDDADKLIQLRGGKNNVMWQKERLLNIAYEHLPEECTKFAWLDCDVIFKNTRWAQETCELLDTYSIVQPFDWSVRLQPGEKDIDITTVESATYEKRKGLAYAFVSHEDGDDFFDKGHTGFAWAARKEIFKEDGFYDKMIVGGGDSVLACGIFGRSTYKFTHILPQKLIDDQTKWINSLAEKINEKIYYTEGGLLHLWHGKGTRRATKARLRLLKIFGFDPQIDVKKTKEGYFKWAPGKEQFAKKVADYFWDRNEDGSIIREIILTLRNPVKKSIELFRKVVNIRTTVLFLAAVFDYCINHKIVVQSARLCRDITFVTLLALYGYHEEMIVRLLLPYALVLISISLIITYAAVFKKLLWYVYTTGYERPKSSIFYYASLLKEIIVRIYIRKEYKKEKLSVVILNWKRPSIVKRIIHTYAKLPFVHDIVIWNNNPENKFEFVHPKVKVVNCKHDAGLDSRYAATMLCDKEYVLIHDDDLLLATPIISLLWARFLEKPGLIHCLVGRNVSKDYNTKNVYGKVDIVLTQCQILNRKYVKHYFDEIARFDFVREYTCGNGEDIIMNYVVRSITKEKNISHCLPYKNFYVLDKNVNKVAIQHRPFHREVRNEITNMCKNRYTNEIEEFMPNMHLLEQLESSSDVNSWTNYYRSSKIIEKKNIFTCSSNVDVEDIYAKVVPLLCRKRMKETAVKSSSFVRAHEIKI